jgi:hypothetical protein
MVSIFLNRAVNQITILSILIIFPFIPVTVCFSQTKLVDLVQKSKPAIIVINTYDKNNKSLALGTGFFIDSKGTILSNYHVFEGAISATVTTFDGKIYSVNNVISQSKEMDVLKFSINNPAQIIFPFLKLAQTKPKEGEDVYVIGNPKGLEFSVSNGIVSSIRYDEKFGQIIQTTTPISSGNSGSPLINLNNEVVGIISFSLIEGQNLNFAISIGNLFSLNDVNNLIFPPPPKDIHKLDIAFKRFEWGTYSSTVKTNEKLEFKEQKPKGSDEFSLDYLASIGNIKVSVSYTFEYDKLRLISYLPINCITKNSITDCQWYYSTEFHIAYSNFISLQEKLIDLFGDNYIEIWRKVNQSYEKTSGIIDFPIITKNQFNTNNNLSLFKDKISIKDDAFGTFFIAHSWNSEINNATYQIVFQYDEKPLLGLRDNVHKWSCFLVVMPLENEF